MISAIFAGALAAWALTVTQGTALSLSANGANQTSTYTISATVGGNENGWSGATISFPANTNVSGLTAANFTTSWTSGTRTLTVSGQNVTLTWTTPPAKNASVQLIISGIRNASQPSVSYLATMTAAGVTNTGPYPMTYTIAANANAPASVTATAAVNTAGQASAYTVAVGVGTFGRLDSSPAVGPNTIAVTFPAAYTSLPSPVASNVTVNGTPATTVTKAGNTYTIAIPTGVSIPANSTATMVFNSAFGIVNPTAGSYSISASTSAETGTSSGSVTIAASPASLTVSQGSDSGRPTTKVYASQGTTRAVDEINLAASGGAVTVGQIVVRGLDTAAALNTDVQGVSLWRDNGDGTFNSATDTQLGATQIFSGATSGSTATFSSLARTISAGSTDKVWIVYKFYASAVDTHVLGSQVNNGDVTATAGSVNTFSNIVSANSGQTVQIDASSPTISVTDPSVNTTLTGTTKIVSGTATDYAGSGVSTVQLRIQRSDGQYWTGAGWTASATSVAASTSNGWSNWTYSWALDPNQNASLNTTATYTITATATDALSQSGASSPVSGLKVDNVAPSVSSASSVDGTHVNVVFSEPLSAGTVAASDFSIAGLTVSGYSMPASDTVQLTTSAQTAGQNYTVTATAGTMADLAGNTNILSSAPFTGYPSLTVAQGADSGRPTTKVYASQSATKVVDELALTAAGGNLTPSQIVVRGLDTVAALTTDVQGVSLWRDNGDGAFNSATDTQLGTTQVFSGATSGSTATFSGLASVITSGTTAKVWVVYRVGSSAIDGHAVGSQVNTTDVTVSGATLVQAANIVSANTGQTVQIDAAAPSVSVTDPVSSAILLGTSKTISGTATDFAGSGVTQVQVQVARSDGKYWDGTAWSGTASWLAASTANGWLNWSYAWTPLDSQNNGPYTYSVTARATDNAALTGTSSAVTGIVIDNTAPTVVSANGINSTTVDVVFSEALQSGSPVLAKFTIAGLTVSNAVLQPDGVTVRLTTSAQTGNQSYTVACAAGAVADAAGNSNAAGNAGFTATVPGGITVVQGADVGRPNTKVYQTPGSSHTVDELLLAAGSTGGVTVSQVVVRGLDSAATLRTDVASVSIYRDNGLTSGLWDAGDTRLGTAQTFSGDASGSTATFAGLSLNIPANVTEKIWIVYTLGSSAVDGRAVGSQVSAGDVVASSGSVAGFSDIISANSGQTLRIDAAAPVVSITDPASSAILLGTSKTISGTATDFTGSGVTQVQVQVARSDGKYWDGSAWNGTSGTWLTATSSNGWLNWSYAWTPLDSQDNGPNTYSITARATDNAALTGTSSAATGIVIDNTLPRISAVNAIDTNLVNVVFSEPLNPATIAATDFSISGLSITGASLLPGNATVQLNTTTQGLGQAYTLACTAGAVADVAGNSNAVQSVGFNGFSGTISAPTDVKATAGSAPPVIATITWTASSGSVAGYRVWRSTSLSGAFGDIGTTTALSFEDTSGISGQSYYYKVSAMDAQGRDSAFSATTAATNSEWAVNPHGESSLGAGATECQTCHVPHVATTNKLMRSTGATSTTGQTAVCANCHDGRVTNAANVITGLTNSFGLASGHNMDATTSGTAKFTEDCATCHDVHADPATMPSLPTSTINGKSVTNGDRSACEACHDDTNDWYGAGYPSMSSPTLDSAGYPVLGTFPGPSVYNNISKNAHAGIPASPTSDRVAGSCLYCHSSHGSLNKYDGLTLTMRPSTMATLVDDQANGSFAQACFYCHGGALPSELSTMPVDIKQFATAGGSYGGHRIQTAGGKLPVGSPMPCYDCHNAHGSSRGNAAMLSDTLGANLGTATDADTRHTCLSCHSTADGKVWDSTLGSMANVGSQTVEGLRRDGSDGSVLHLPSITGHQSGDTQSCENCHGADYGTGGFNVHNPSAGASPGGVECYTCHSTYQTYMEDGSGSRTGSQRTATYHHVMGGNYDGGTYQDGDFAPGSSGTYDSTSKTDVFCVSCHVDHDKIGTQKGANLRSTFTSSTVNATNTDFSASLDSGGLCTSCHKTTIAKDLNNQLSTVTSAGPGVDDTTRTPLVDSAKFAGSAHDYNVTSTFRSGGTFNGDCSKCHNDDNTDNYKQMQSGAIQFGPHFSTTEHLLSVFGVTPSEPVEENDCFGCHAQANSFTSAKTVAGRDYYGAAGATMSAAAEDVYFQFDQLNSQHPVAGTSAVGSNVLACGNCHNTHVATAANPVADPNNTYNAQAYSSASDQTTFCLKCHDGSLPARQSNDTTYVPSTVVMQDPASANKSTNAARSHWTANGSISSAETVACAGCHDSHGSNAPKLLGQFQTSDTTSRINGVAITADDNTVCAACHASASTSFPATEGQRQVGTGYLMNGTWPGSARYNTSYVGATHTGNGHLNATWPGLTYAAGDCKNCHDPHGTANTYDELRSSDASGSYSFTSSSFTMCFRCHGTKAGQSGFASVNILQYYPASSGGSGVGTFAGHQIQTAGGNLSAGQAMPCYDCHNPHGSAGQYGLQVRDIGDATGEIDLSSDAGYRRFCLSCHATADTSVGWNGSAYVAVGTTTVEGLRRDGSDGSSLKLPSVSGHNSSDTQPCYQCHGNDYSSSGSNNPHNPSGGVSTGGQSCYTCHSDYQTYMEDSSGSKTGSSNKSTYHHVLGGSAGDGDLAPGSGTYQTSTSEVYCTSCHTDHNNFNGSHSSNLRSDITNTSGSAKSDSDYSTSTNTGICTSCHALTISKDTANQKSDGSTSTPKIVAGSGSNQYGASAHSYAATSTFSDATTFKANCAKCHNDENSPAYKNFQTSSVRFGTHWSAERHILSSLGQALTDPLDQTECYGCHSGNVAGTDYYGVQPMTKVARSTQVQFGLASKHPVVATNGNSVDCVNCHNPHVVTATTGKVTDPANTYQTKAYATESDKAAFCLVCHSSAASLPTTTTTNSTFVPKSVTIASADQPLMNVSAYSANSHWSAHGSISAGEIQSCAACHDNHGSNYPHLLGSYDATAGANKINGVAITGNNNTVCAACHATASTGFPNGSRDASGYPSDGTWPGTGVYNTSFDPVSHTGDMHNTTNTILPGTTYAAGDCKNCHDVHGTSNSHDELQTKNQFGQVGVYDFSPSNFSFCFNCHDTDGPSATNIKTYYPGSVGGSSGGSGHTIKDAGGTLPVGGVVPCYDCHNPHGSNASAYGLTIATPLSSTVTTLVGDVAGELNMSPAQQATPNNIRNFCLTCHTTSDTTKGWNGSALVAITSGAKIEGLDRTTAPVLHLPDFTGHHEADTNLSCYQCHGNDYTSLSGNNVHNPSGGVSTGGTDCYTCHAGYQTYMEDGQGTKVGTSRASVYHHVLGGTISSTYYDGDKALATTSTGTNYPTSTTTVFCESCHVDHGAFKSGTRSANLRVDVASGSVATSTSDYSTTTNTGICTSCHATSLAKQLGGDQASDGTTMTAKVVAGSSAGQFGSSAHSYAATSSFDDNTVFNANCSKCHNDENNPTYKDFQTTPDGSGGTLDRRFGPHWSVERRLLNSLGLSLTDPLGSQACYNCHSGGTAGSDYYGVKSMTALERSTYQQFTGVGIVSTHPVVATGGNSVACVNCHNPHVASLTNKVVDPANTYNVYSYDTTSTQATFCLKCHSSAASLPAYQMNSTTSVPATVTIAAADQGIMNESANAARAHWTASGSIASTETVSCGVCHDNHGSKYPRLLGSYDATAGANKISGQAITGNNNTVCTACHTGASQGFPGTSRDASGYPVNGTWPGNAVFSGATGIHRGATVIWPGSTYTGGDCKNCHDVHGTANNYDELVTTSTVQSYSSSTYSLCFNCHGASGPSAYNIMRYYPTTNGGGATQAAGTNYGHAIEASSTLPSGSGLPCYDCHGVHGSLETTYGLQVVTQTSSTTTIVVGDGSGELNIGTATGYRQFCFTCHTTADTTKGWTGAGGYAVITAGAKVEGIDRTVYDTTNKRGLHLPSVSGHNEADTAACSDCHGKDYSGATTNNVHNPGPGGSNGGTDCLTCHGSSSTLRLDKMVNDTASYHHVLDAGTPGVAPAAGAYPSSTSSLACVSCHVDHNYFNNNKGANLRTNVASTTVNAANSDFVNSAGSGYGICVSCHSGTQAKSTTQASLSYASTQTPVISGSQYAASLHNYNVPSTFGDGSNFQANCAKCHDDEQSTLKTYQTSTYKFGVHYSAESRIALALGSTVTTSPAVSSEERLCYQCHTAAKTAGNDGYGVAAMSAKARTIKADVEKRFAHRVEGFTGIHKADESGVAPSTVAPGAATGWWGTSNSKKHVECEDCHNPHAAQAARPAPSASNVRAANTAVVISPSNAGVWGVDISGASSGLWSSVGTTGTAVAPTYTKLTTAAYEWQLCLKCHSIYAWGNTPPTSESANLGGLASTTATMTDVGKDFSTTNYAYHPLFKAGRNQPAVTLNTNWNSSTDRRLISGSSTNNGISNTLTDGWISRSLVTCGDCHGSDDPAGPTGAHGSSRRWLLQSADPNIAVTIAAGTVKTPNAGNTELANYCLNCHRRDVYTNGDEAAQTDALFSRFGHPANTSCMDRTLSVVGIAGCMNCHGGRKDDNSYGTTVAAQYGQAGAMHGTSMGTAGVTGSDPMGERFCNGAAWKGHQLGGASGSIGCQTIGSTDNAYFSTCTHHGGKWTTTAPNYAYGFGQ